MADQLGRTDVTALRVVVADDQTVVREGLVTVLRLLPGIEVVAAAADGLTPREVEVLRLIAAGLSNQEIARQLTVSEATVKTHINHLFAKANLRDRSAAVAYAYTHKLD
jgi:DNA-binding NarL/FixJ family response regulator